MYWTDEGYLLSKTNFDENSIIIEAFTLEHGKYSGIVYGGSSRKQKKNLQIGNKISFNWRSKNENKAGYFNIELINPVSPFFFDDKKRSICILSATSILKILLPSRETNKNIYHSFENMLNNLKYNNWINLYISWELSLINQLGYEVDFIDKKNINFDSKKYVDINDKLFKVPNLILHHNVKENSKEDVREALTFNKLLFMENFLTPNKLRLPISRIILEKYYI